MRSNEQRIFELARKWQNGTITETERREFDEWFDSFDDHQLVDADNEPKDELKERLYASIAAKNGQRGRSIPLKKIMVAAAAVMLLLGGSWLYFSRSAKHPAMVASSTKKATIVPGSNRAFLTLANGSTLVLDSAKNGLVATQGTADIIKKQEGEISYAAAKTANAMKTANAKETANAADATDAAIVYNTVTTPRGGQYAIRLPDGSRVWLNAASSIRFPTAFNGTSRKVELQGEAYFEVAPDKAKPFRVTVDKKMDVEVLGTAFNIMAYEEEGGIRTTLVEGAVRTVRDDVSRVLRPGQQALLKEDNSLTLIDKADVEAALAWKNGLTLFAGEDIKAILRKASRWYDVDIEYQGPIPQRTFTGGISRRSDISALLKILELNQIHYTVQGKKVIIMP